MDILVMSGQTGDGYSPQGLGSDGEGNAQPAVPDARVAAPSLAGLILAGLALWLVTGISPAGAAPAADSASATGASALLARHDALQNQLAFNPYKRPMVIESSRTSGDVKGDIYAVVPHPFGVTSAALAGSQGWCEILILHVNTKYCRVAREQNGTALLMNVGKKYDQPLADSFSLKFAWRLEEKNANYMRVLLTADTGPLSTHDYRIVLEDIPLESGGTFLHLSYEYAFGLAGRVALMAYLNTAGRSKVGFTVTGKDGNGEPAFVDGIRGLVERNTMRYYLAIESFLGSLATPQNGQFEKRIVDWFTASERYPRQLHEIEQADYLDMKRREYRRQQSGQTPGPTDLG